MPENPFVLLDSYQKEDKDRFFGRNKETAQLFNAVQSSNLVLVYGASGTGKTSLINCGLANKYVSSDWLPIFIRRQNNLNQSLHRQLKFNFSKPEMFEEDVPLRQNVRQLYIDHFRPIYLIFDQFEELYISGKRPEQKTFHRTISDLLQSGLQCKIIFIIREEYLAYLAEFEKMVPSLFDNRLRIEKMNMRNLGRVVVGTARYGNIQIVNPRQTVPIILNNLRSQNEGIDLTNLQVYLDKLWRTDVLRQNSANAEITQIVFDEDLVEKVGPMRDVLSDFLDEELQNVEVRLAKRGMEYPDGIPLEILFTLVTEDGTKRNMGIMEIMDKLPQNRNIRESDVVFCLEEFHRIRLMRSFADED